MNIKVAFLAIGEHGDCTVITFDGPGRQSCIVIDGGEGSKGEKALSAYLNNENIEELDLVIGSHLDADHINGLKMFAETQAKAKEARKPYIAIHNYWGPLPRAGGQAAYSPQSAMASSSGGGFITTQQYVMESVKQNEDLLVAIRKLVPAQNIYFPSRASRPPQIFNSISLEVLGPDIQVPASTFEKEAMSLGLSLGAGGAIRDGDDISKLVSAVNDEVEALAQQVDRTINNQSIVIRLTPLKEDKKWQFLFPGDAAQESWDDMTGETSVRKALSASVLKIPHHGSALHGINLAGIKAVRPQYAVNLVGQKHGLPDKPTLALLRGAGSKILCTQRNDDNKKKSACYGLPGNVCPAKNDPKHIIFTIDTSTGQVDIEPKNRTCLNPW